MDGLECCDKYDTQMRIDSINNYIILNKDSINNTLKFNVNLLQVSNKSLVDEVIECDDKLTRQTNSKKKWIKIGLTAIMIIIVETIIILK